VDRRSIGKPERFCKCFGAVNWKPDKDGCAVCDRCNQLIDPKKLFYKVNKVSIASKINKVPRITAIPIPPLRIILSQSFFIKTTIIKKTNYKKSFYHL